MRQLLAISTAAVLLSGCSWVGNNTALGDYVRKNTVVNNHCQIAHANMPIPRGCHPSQVTIGTGVQLAGQYGNQYGGQYAGGFAQTPDFSNGQYTTGGYGSHADSVRKSSTTLVDGQAIRPPRFRGSLSLGIDKSFKGDLADSHSSVLPSLSYNPDSFREGTRAIVNDVDVSTEYTATTEQVILDSISYDSIYRSPTTIQAGLEYILDKNSTVFANLGYTYADGESPAADIQATLWRITEQQPLDALGAPSGAPIVVSGFNPNQIVAEFDYNFSDLKRTDVELGYRKYLDPIFTAETNASVTPFVSAAVGLAHLNEASYSVSQRQLFLQRAFEDQGHDFYDVILPNTRYEVSEAQWVPKGQLSAGVEWQVSPKTALAFETAVKIQQGRELVNDTRADHNVSIPFTVRGSYNF